MKMKTLVTAVVAAALAACGGNPKEVAYFKRFFEIRCQLAYKCLSADQRNRFGLNFYVGTSEADCNAVNGVEAAQEAADDHLRTRNLDQNLGNLCLDAIAKFSCTDFQHTMAQFGPYSSDQQTAKSMYIELGAADGNKYACVTTQNACLGEPACSLAMPGQACNPTKIAPAKDPATAANENKALSDANAATEAFCGADHVFFGD
jgi:hypothetical protein